MNERKLQKAAYFAGLVLLTVTTLTGCASDTKDDEPLVVVSADEGKTKYKTTMVTVGDVTKTGKVTVNYVQSDEQNVSFSVSGRFVSEVYVKSGDHVQKGDKLASLSSAEQEERMKELEYEIEKNTYILGLLLEDEEKDKYRIQDIEDSIELDTYEYEKLQAEIEDGTVYADRDGSVSWVKNLLQGSVSVAGEKVMIVIDDSECVFVLKASEKTKNISKDDIQRLKISIGAGRGEYDIEPINTDDWGSELYYRVTDEYDASVITAGSTGTFEVTIDKKENVLRVSPRAIYGEGEGKYVFVIGQNGQREPRWITTGLEGDSFVEVLEGLTEGERVILK